MLSDEVLDNIQILKFFHDKCTSEKSIGMMQVYRVDELAKAIETILNFIEKQQKEIEKLKENNGYHLGFIDGGIVKRYEYQDKIKAKIDEVDKDENASIPDFMEYAKEYAKQKLQSLLEKE